MALEFFQNGQAEFAAADLVVLPIPYEASISYLPGAAKGPEAIVRASEQLELYDWETRQDISGLQVHTVPQFGTISDVKALWQHVQGVTERIQPAKQFYLGIGGDHTVTIPAFESFHKKFGEIGIVQIDAHADLRNEYQNNKYSHACIMRRIAEMTGPENIVSVGIRAICQEEHQYILEHKMKVIYGNKPLHEDLLPDLNEKLAKLPEKVFLTIDLDGLDPTIMPHVGTPVPGGLSWAQTIAVVKRVFERKSVVAADVVEIASGPGSDRSDFIAARLVSHIAQLAVN